MSVDIDLSNAGIPGLPKTMTIKNAAQEDTLQEILKILQASNKTLNKIANNRTGGGAGGGGAGGSGGGGSGGGGSGAGNSSPQNLLKTFGKSGKAAGSLASSFGKLAGGVVNMGTAVVKAAELLAELGLKALGVAKALANVSDSMVNAANSLNQIPVVGSFLAETLGAAAESAERLYGEFTSLSTIGVTFSGSMTNMVNAASGAGLTIEQFNGVLKNSGPMLASLAGSTEEGAKRFAQLSKTMRTSGLSSELLRLGYTTEQVNSGMASYMGSVSNADKLSSMSTAQLASGSAKYLREIDLLAKVTGESRETKQKEAEELAKNVQFQAAINHLAPDQQASMRNMILMLPKSARAAAQDMLATGSITSEASSKFNSMFPELSATMRGANAAIRSGEGLSLAAQSQILDTFATESKTTFQRNSERLKYDRSMDDAALAAIEGQKMQTGVLYKSIEAQKKSNAEAADVEQIAKFKQQIAETGNKFTLALMNMGALETLQSAFTGLANFTSNYLMPIINGMYAGMGALTPIWDGLLAVISPFTDVLKSEFDGLLNLLGGSDGLSGIMTFIGNLLKVFGKVISVALTPLKLLIRVATGISSAFMEFLQPTFDQFSGGMTFLVSAMQTLDDAIANAIDGIFSYLPPMLNGITKEEATRRKNQRAADALKRKEDEKAKKDEEKAKKEKEKDRKATEESTEATINETAEKEKLVNASKKLDLSSPESIARSVAASVGGTYASSSTGTSGSSSAGVVADVPANMQQYLKATAFLESGGNANAKAGTSSASGLFQFIDKTWETMVKQMGKNYSKEDRFDPKKATEVMAFFTEQQKKQLEKSTGKAASNTDLYMAHFLGASGASQFIKAKNADPNQSAAAMNRKNAAANKGIYYDNGRERTVAEVYELMAKKMANAEKVVATGKAGKRDLTFLNTLIGGGAAQPSTIVQPANTTVTNTATAAKTNMAQPTVTASTTTATNSASATSSAPQSSTNELLISLNNKIDRLININLVISELSSNQLRVQKELGNNGLLVK